MEFLKRAAEPVNTLIQTKGWTPVTGRLFDNRRHKNDHSVRLPTQQDSRQIRLHDVILEESELHGGLQSTGNHSQQE